MLKDFNFDSSSNVSEDDAIRNVCKMLCVNGHTRWTVGAISHPLTQVKQRNISITQVRKELIRKWTDLSKRFPDIFQPIKHCEICVVSFLN